jgi:hypothetical protein
MRSPRALPVVAILAVLGGALPCALAQQPTVGLLLHDPRAQVGYTLFPPQQSTSTYLVDIDGRIVHSWSSTRRPGTAAYLLDDGRLLRCEMVPGNPTFTGTGGAGGAIVLRQWDGTLDWQFTYSTADHLQHHDATALPSGNVLFIAWERKTSAEAIAAGRNPALLSRGELWPDTLVEVQPDGAGGATIVWEWHLFDHLVQDFDSSKANYGVVADHPELVDVNFTGSAGGPGGADWTHANAVKHDAALDQIVFSAHNLGEIWIIDHSTTTTEAAGHSGGRSGRGGDLLYRWGNPRAYRAGVAADQRLFGQHDAQWIPDGRPGAGHLLLFNNGVGRPAGMYSSIEEIEPPIQPDGSYLLVPGEAYGPAASTWTYTTPTPTDLYAQVISGAQRMVNGDTLICDGPKGTFFEVTAGGEEVWRYVNPVMGTGILTQGDAIGGGPGGQANSVFKIRRYDADFPGLSGRDLTPGGPLEPYALLRNADTTALSPLRPDPIGIFTGTGVMSLDPVGDRYIRPFVTGDVDATACPGSPLVFYEINSGTYVIRLARESACAVRVEY